MTEAALAPLRELVSRATELMRIVDAEQAWGRPSACAGWSVQDVVAHLAQMFHSLYAPTDMPADSGVAERNADLAVEAVRGLSSSDIVAHYRSASEQGLAVLDKLQTSRPERPIPMAELGHYPRHLLADAFVFDHYCHLAHDLLGPAAPFPVPHDYRAPEISDPVVGWMLAGLPQMCREPLLDVLDDVLLLELSGPAGGAWLVSPGDDVTVAAPDAAAAARVRSTDVAFTSWATRRSDWRTSDVVLAGDTELATRVLDAINIV